MEIFRRQNSKSKLEFIPKDSETCIRQNKLGNFDTYEDENGVTILQIAELNDFYIIESMPWGEEAQATEPIDYQKNEYLEEVINFDPFGGKYTKQPIKAIFEAGDKEWLDRALKEMKNEYIRSRLDYIVKHGGYGKIRG